MWKEYQVSYKFKRLQQPKPQNKMSPIAKHITETNKELKMKKIP